MEYKFRTGEELRSIIAEIEKGEYPTFLIYNEKGRRVKYDFDTHKALVLLQDDKVPQVNPFYKEPEQVVVEEEVVEESPAEEEVVELPAEEVVEDLQKEELPKEEVTLDENTQDSEETPCEDEPAEELTAEEELTEAPQEEVVVTEESESEENHQDGEVEDTKSEEIPTSLYEDRISELEADINEKDERIRNLLNENKSLVDKIVDLEVSSKEEVEFTTDQLIDELVKKGYKVTISK